MMGGLSSVCVSVCVQMHLFFGGFGTCKPSGVITLSISAVFILMKRSEINVLFKAGVYIQKEVVKIWFI